jgi:phosphate-selective porin OprO/OprP
VNQRWTAQAAALAVLAAGTPGAAAAQGLDALQARMEAMEAQLRAQAAKIDAQAAEISALKAERAQAPVATAVAAPAPAPPPASPRRPAGETSAAAAPPEPPGQLTLPNGRPTFASADGRFDASLFTVLQVDAAHYFQDPARPPGVDFRRDADGGASRARDLSSGAALRRARIGLEGRLFDDFDYAFVAEFSGEEGARVNQAWLQYTGFAPLRVRMGAFGPSDELEGVSPKTAFSLLEAAAVTDAVRPLAGADGRFGVQVFGFGPRWFASTALTSSSINTSGDAQDDPLAVVGRLAGRPLVWKDGFLHVGTHATYVLRVADAGGPDAPGPRRTVQFRARPEVRVDNTRLIGTGPIPADHAFTSGLEIAFEHRNLLLQGEGFLFGANRPEPDLRDPRFFGWYVSASWMLTGEHRRYNPANASVAEPQVRRAFDPARGLWGAFELAAKYSVLDLDDNPGAAGTPIPIGGVRGGEQRTLSGGLNWYLNSSVRLMMAIQDVHIRRLSPDPVRFATPTGAQIGQRFQVLAFRSQVAF